MNVGDDCSFPFLLPYPTDLCFLSLPVRYGFADFFGFRSLCVVDWAVGLPRYSAALLCRARALLGLCEPFGFISRRGKIFHLHYKYDWFAYSLILKRCLQQDTLPAILCYLCDLVSFCCEGLWFICYDAVGVCLCVIFLFLLFLSALNSLTCVVDVLHLLLLVFVLWALCYFWCVFQKRLSLAMRYRQLLCYADISSLITFITG